jgi:hypothetical protein
MADQPNGILLRYERARGPDSVLSLFHPEPTKSLTVLFEIRGRVVEDFVLLKKGVDLRPGLESKEPPKLRRGQGTRSKCLEC